MISFDRNLLEKLSKNNTVIVAHNVKFDVPLPTEITRQITETNHSSLLNALLEFHKQRCRQNSTKDYCPVRAFVVEIESYLSNEAEELLLLYMYLLRTGSTLPRLFILMMCRVKPIIEVVCSITGETVPSYEPVNSATMDYSMAPANFIDVMSQKQNKCIILDPNDDELYNDIGERCKTFTELIQTLEVPHRATPLETPHRVASLETPHRATPLETQREVASQTIVCLSPTIRIATSSLYTGNKRMKRTICEEYLSEAISVIKSVNPTIRIIIPRDTTGSVFQPSFREALSKDFSQDIINFARSGLSLQMLYKHYIPNDTVIRSRIAQNEALITRLNFLTQSKNPLSHEAFIISSFKVHPLIARVILLWHTLGKPMFPILLFTSVIHTFERSVSETKEHGLKEVENNVASNSKYGETMEKMLSILQRTGQADSPELGRTGLLLKKLITKAREFFKETPIQIQTFNLGRFTLLLADLLKSNFPNEILVRVPDGQKTGTVLYRNAKHPQILWKVNNNPSFNEVFPIISMLERNSNRVLFYVPL